MTLKEQVISLIKERDDYEKVLQDITGGYNSSDDKMWWVRDCRKVLRRYGKLKYPRLTFRQQIINPMKKRGELPKDY